MCFAVSTYWHFLHSQVCFCYVLICVLLVRAVPGTIEGETRCIRPSQLPDLCTQATVVVHIRVGQLQCHTRTVLNCSMKISVQWLTCRGARADRYIPGVDNIKALDFLVAMQFAVASAVVPFVSMGTHTSLPVLATFALTISPDLCSWACHIVKSTVWKQMYARSPWPASWIQILCKHCYPNIAVLIVAALSWQYMYDAAAAGA